MAEHQEEHGHSDHSVTILVNNQPVRVPRPKVTGLEIKQAAIAQGVKIELSFVLQEELPNRHTKVIGDTDEIAVNAHSRFVAVAPDDNS